MTGKRGTTGHLGSVLEDEMGLPTSALPLFHRRNYEKQERKERTLWNNFVRKHWAIGRVGPKGEETEIFREKSAGGGERVVEPEEKEA